MQATRTRWSSLVHKCFVGNFAWRLDQWAPSGKEATMLLSSALKSVVNYKYGTDWVLNRENMMNSLHGNISSAFNAILHSVTEYSSTLQRPIFHISSRLNVKMFCSILQWWKHRLVPREDAYITITASQVTLAVNTRKLDNLASGKKIQASQWLRAPVGRRSTARNEHCFSRPEILRCNINTRTPPVKPRARVAWGAQGASVLLTRTRSRGTCASYLFLCLRTMQARQEVLVTCRQSSTGIILSLPPLVSVFICESNVCKHCHIEGGTHL